MALITAAVGGGNWTVGSTWVGGVAPTAADDALLTSASGNVTIDSGAVCRSLDCNTYTGTLTHSSGVTLTIGDGTAGTGNIALRLVSGMTYTKGSTTTSAISFISTSATVQTVTCGGKTLGNITFNASSNGSWQFSDAFSCGAATLTFTKGTLNTNGQSVTCGTFTANDTNVKTLTLGASAIAVSAAWSLSTSSNTTFNANTSAITVNTTSVTFNGGAKTYNDVILSGMTITNSFISGANTFANLTLSNSTVKTTEIAMQANQTITGTLTITGNSVINRLLIKTGTLGTSQTLTAATVTASNCDFMDITGAGAASWNLSAITGNSGDCGGNSGITFTTGATQTATGTASFTWSTHGWTSRVPLPQDDVVINNAFVAGRVVTQDMPRAGKSIDFTGATGSPTFTPTTIFTLYGSFTFISGMTVTTGSYSYIFGGRGAFTLTSAGKTIDVFDVRAPGGSLTLQDNLSCVASANSHTLVAGTLDFNNFDVTMSRLSISGSTTRTFTAGSGTLTLAGTGTVFNAVTATNLTVTATTGTIKITDTSATARTFSGGGKTYGTLWSAAGSSTANLTIAGSNTFTEFKDTGTAAHSILFTAGTTQTVGTFTVSGSAGNAITINSTTTATHALVKTGGGTISCDYLNIQHSVATPATTWYAGVNSTDNQAVATAGSGWIFTAPPAGGLSIPIAMHHRKMLHIS